MFYQQSRVCFLVCLFVGCMALMHNQLSSDILCFCVICLLFWMALVVLPNSCDHHHSAWQSALSAEQCFFYIFHFVNFFPSLQHKSAKQYQFLFSTEEKIWPIEGGFPKIILLFAEARSAVLINWEYKKRPTLEAWLKFEKIKIWLWISNCNTNDIENK